MLLVLDGNNLAWAGFHALRRAMGAETPEQKVRAALLGLAGSVLGLVARGGEPPEAGPVSGVLSGVAIAFDEGRPLRRRSIFPAYQTGREADPAFIDNEPLVLQAIAEFSDFARALPITVLRGTNTEADDLIAAFVLRDERPARIASTDRDFLQLVDHRVSVWSPVKRVHITEENFAEHTAPRESSGAAVVFPRERYLDYRASSGDASDNLPGIPGIGAITAARMLAHAPLDAYLEAKNALLLRAAIGRRVRALEEAFADGTARATIERNRGLMDLRAGAGHYPSLEPYARVGRWDEAACREWIAEQRLTVVDTAAVCRAFSELPAPPVPA